MRILVIYIFTFPEYLHQIQRYLYHVGITDLQSGKLITGEKESFHLSLKLLSFFQINCNNKY